MIPALYRPSPARRKVVAAAATGPSAGYDLWLNPGSLSLSDGDPVGTYTGSGTSSGYSLTASGSARPTYRTGQINGRPALEWTGSQYLAGGALSRAQPFTVAAVVLLSSTSGDRSLFDSNGSGRVVAYCGSGSSAFTTFAGSLGGTSAVGTGTAMVLSLVFNGASSAARKNAASIGTGNWGAAGLNTNLYLGSNYLTSANWRGLIADLIVRPGSDPTADEAYLNGRYAAY